MPRSPTTHARLADFPRAPRALHAPATIHWDAHLIPSIHASDPAGGKGLGAYAAEGNEFYRCTGTFCSRTTCALILEKNKVFRADGTFCNKGDGAFVIEGNTVHLAEGAFANKSDAILQVEGDIPMIALLTILTGL